MSNKSRSERFVGVLIINQALAMLLTALVSQPIILEVSDSISVSSFWLPNIDGLAYVLGTGYFLVFYIIAIGFGLLVIFTRLNPYHQDFKIYAYWNLFASLVHFIGSLQIFNLSQAQLAPVSSFVVLFISLTLIIYIESGWSSKGGIDNNRGFLNT